MAALANGQDGKSRADWLVWELYALIGAAILSTALILLGNAAPTSLWLLAVLAAAIWQALLLPSAAAWFGALAVLLAWVLARQASGAWAQAEVLQIGLEAAGLAASLFLAARFRRHWEQQQQEMSELRGLRRALVEGEPGTGLLPREVAELAARFGIKVYTIGAGYTGYAPFPVRRADGRVSLQRMPVEIDETTLRQIAEKSGGRYFHATDEAGLREVVAEIGELERSKVAELRYLEYEHHYRLFVAVALAATALAVLLASTWLRRLPA